jgi:ABC-type anion transport system duplicated permease subunit
MNENLTTDMQQRIFWLCAGILVWTAIIESAVLFLGVPNTLPEIMAGRILGWFESMGGLAVGYWLSTSHSSAIKNGLVSKVAEGRK